MVKGPFSDTISLSSNTSFASSSLFSTGVLYNNQDPYAFESTPATFNKTVGKKVDQFDTASLRSQEDTLSLVSSSLR